MIINKLLFFLKQRYTPILLLCLIISALYYKLFLFGLIPFPGDLLVGSYSPWFDYYKISVQNPLISDVFSTLILWKYLSLEEFTLGQWPLWNPYSFMGTPLLATYQSATLYPLNILLLLPKYFGWGIFIFSQTLLAAVNMYLFLTLVVKSQLARLTGAVTFALGGLMTTWLETGVSIHAVIWLPLSFYCIEKYWREFKLRYLFFLTLVASLLILAGHAQISTFSFILLFVYLLVFSINNNLKTFFFRFFPPLFFLTLSVFICAPQLLPSLDLLQKSIRLTEEYIKESNFGLLSGPDIFKFFIADFFGNPVTRNYWGSLNYLETSGFVGTLNLPLIIYAYLFLKKDRINLFFLALLSLTLLLAFDNLISRSIYQMKIPLLTSSYAGRILFISNLAISILSAFSLNQILENIHNHKKFLNSIVWSWAIILGIFCGILIVHFYLSHHNIDVTNFLVAQKNSLIPVILISFFLLFFNILKKFKSPNFVKNFTVFICTVLFLLNTLDLGRYFLKFNPFVSQNLIFPNTPALDFLKKQEVVFRIGREHAEVLPPNTWMVYKLSSYEGYDPIYLNNYGKFMHFLNGGDIRTGHSSRYAELTSKYISPYLDAANVKYFMAILKDKDGSIPGNLLNEKFKETNYKLVFYDYSSAILENPDALERIYFAPSVVTMLESKIEDMMMDDPNFDPRKVVALSDNLNINSVTGKGNVEIIHYSPNLIKINTDTKSEEVLVLADQYEEGWKATIDKRKVQISPANFIFRAVKIPPGNHQVIFYYWPKSFDLGLKISLLAISLYTFLVLFSFKMNKFFLKEMNTKHKHKTSKLK